MKLVLLLRHAKSDRTLPTPGDRARPLAARGRRAASLIGAHMRDQGWQPALVLCSPARRAVETLELLGLDAGKPVTIEDGLYGADAEDLVVRLQRIEDRFASVLVVGHNPALQVLAVALAAAGDPGLRAGMAAKYPTGALAMLEFDAGRWCDIGLGAGRLTAFVRPRDVEGYPSPQNVPG